MDAIGKLLASIEGGDAAGFGDALAPDAVLDATVPDWRFSVTGREAIADQFSRWYPEPGSFEDVKRTPIPDGELVEFLITWQLNGVPHAAHQVHLFTVKDGYVARDVMFCGGRWSAARLAEMEAAAKA